MILYDEKFIIAAKELLSSAKQRIDISTYKAEYTTTPRGKALNELFEILIRKKSEGVLINFIVNQTDHKRTGPRSNIIAIKKLKEKGINPRILPDNRCCHAKIIIVDQEKAIIGSHNLSIRSTTENFEISTLLSDEISVSFVQAVYNKNLAVSKEPR